MGILRAILALSVVFAHSWPDGLMFVGGRNAVQLFYIISGFLISYVLVEANAYKTVRAFYLNRYLRLYPIYLCVAVLTLCFLVVARQHELFDLYRKIPDGAAVLLTLSNMFLFGQDWIMFSGVESNRLTFTPNFIDSEVVLYQGLLVPQAWTLGVELSFYVIAPFILRKKGVMILLLFLSLATRIYLIKMGFGNKDPWTYRFFPTELALFLMGALSHQILLPAYRKINHKKLLLISIVATCFLVLLSMSYFLIPFKDAYKAPLLFVVFLVMLPLAFIYQNSSRIDSYIGNLSYPIYINHMLVIWIVAIFSKLIGVENRYLISIFCVILTIIFAILLHKFIGVPFEKIRRAIKKKNNYYAYDAGGRL